MAGTQLLLLGTLLLASFLFPAERSADAESIAGPIVRIAELEIDPAQLDAYKLALKEEIETSIRVEPGVLTLYAVSLKEHPEQIRLLETYKRCSRIRISLAESTFQNLQESHAADGEGSQAARNRAHPTRVEIAKLIPGELLALRAH
jgi:quinol monooxygenase YgiN